MLVRHDNGWVTAYAHNDEIIVKRGDKIKRGQVMAKAGKTGSVDQPQVHFELRQGSKPVDPMPYMRKTMSTALGAGETMPRWQWGKLGPDRAIRLFFVELFVGAWLPASASRAPSAGTFLGR